VAPGDTVEFVVLPTDADQLRTRLLDTRLSPKERLEALSKLDRRGTLDDDTLRIVLELLRTLPEARDRATILRELHGKKSALLVEPLLSYLRDDPDENVREEAAETLDDFLAEPRVLEALTLAKDSDPSAKVRRQAAESLEGGERKGR